MMMKIYLNPLVVNLFKDLIFQQFKMYRVVVFVIIILIIMLMIPSNIEKGIVVFGSSRDEIDQSYLELGTQVGKLLSKDIIVYSAGTTGIVGKVAQSSINLGGKVIGVTTKFYVNIDGIQRGLYKLYVEPTLSIRKARFDELAKGFIILPGGFGTLDETAEIITKSIWENSMKPIILFNYNGYYDPLIQMFETFKSQKFGKDYSSNIIVVKTLDELEQAVCKYF